MYTRSDPDEILKQIVKHTTGRHKIYLGMAPAVGKTYKMLEEALELKKRGVDIVIGYLENQNRSDNEKIIQNFEIIPYEKYQVNGNEFRELNLKAIIERKPACVVIDELAHTNIPGSENKKRYEDIQVLLKNGISVLSTLNVHQIESIAPLVERNINLPVKETVPDSVINKVDELVVVDIPIDQLYQRIKEKQIYTEEQLQHAKNSFFKRNNLLMLRDLALSYLAERVDTEVISEKLTANIKERILVLLKINKEYDNPIQIAKEFVKFSHADVDFICLTKGVMDEKKNIKSIREQVTGIKGNFILFNEKDKYLVKKIIHFIKLNRITTVITHKEEISITQSNLTSKLILQILDVAPNIDIVLSNDLKIGISNITEQNQHSQPQQKINQGQLKIIIGMAPGVGKTYRMLQEAHEAYNNKKKILLGVIDTHGRIETAKQMEGLPILPLRIIEHQDKHFQEFDLENAILEKPDIIFVDELAHTNVPGSINNKRYQDVQYLLRAGINVVTTINIQHIESLNDVIEQFSGIKVRETVPDWIISHANEIVLVDISPEALQERLKEGKVYAVDKIEQSLKNFFQKKNLVALRELSLREVAENVEHELYEYKKSMKVLTLADIHGSTLKLIRKSSRIASRLESELIVAHIVKDTKDLTENKKLSIIELEELVVEIGGDFRLIENTNTIDEIKNIERKIDPLFIILSDTYKKSKIPILRYNTLMKIINQIKKSNVYLVGSKKLTGNK